MIIKILKDNKYTKHMIKYFDEHKSTYTIFDDFINKETKK